MVANILFFTRNTLGIVERIAKAVTLPSYKKIERLICLVLQRVKNAPAGLR